MQRSTFKVLFYVKRQSENTVRFPLWVITINGTMSQFSSKLCLFQPLGCLKRTKLSQQKS